MSTSTCAQWDVLAPSFMVNQKSIKLIPPLVSSRGSVTYGVAKVPAKILKPLVGKSAHHVHSSKDFVERVNKVTLQPHGCLFI